jgi:hypothetical protein
MRKVEPESKKVGKANSSRFGGLWRERAEEKGHAGEMRTTTSSAVGVAEECASGF